jgi:signal transduction histidine kinase
MNMERTSEAIPIRREPVDVGVLVELTTEPMQRQARALGIALTIDVDSEVPDKVSIDRDKVGWAVTSLVGSALQHVPANGGHVSVHVSFHPNDSTLSITVRDDGPGIQPERLHKLLTRGPWRPSSALALLLVEDIARAHGGGLEVQSKTDGIDHFTNILFKVEVR